MTDQAAHIRRARLLDAGGAALIFAATLLAYLPAMDGAPLWDDDRHITRHGLWPLAGLWRIWFQPGATQQYYPLLHSAFWFEHRLWGDTAWGYHLTNVFLHALAAWLVVMIVRRLELPGAWLAGVVFALHPMCVESVAWISEQKTTLSGVFYLGSALCYLHFDQTRRAAHYRAAAGLFMLALMTKTVTATLPAALLVLFWWQRGKLGWKRDARPLAPWLALGAGAGLFTAWWEATSLGAHGSEYALTAVQRFLVAGRVIWFYAAKLLWPANLMFNYPRWNINPGDWRQYLFPAGVGAVAAFFWWMARRHRGPLAALLIFIGSLFPVLGFLNVYPFRYSYVADHFTYLASLGIIVPLASAAAMAARRMTGRWHGAVALGAVLALVLGGLSWRHSRLFVGPETLYRETLAGNPASYMAANNLCYTLGQMPERQAEALEECEDTVRTFPEIEGVHVNLASVLTRMPDRLPEAVAECQTALRLDPSDYMAHLDLGSALSQMPGRLAEAVTQYELALRIVPDWPLAHLEMGNALVRMPGRLADAIAEYQAAVRVKPDFADAHFALGTALLQMPGRRQEAMAELEAAASLRPD